jgi:hypothetical protein
MTALRSFEEPVPTMYGATISKSAQALDSPQLKPSTMVRVWPVVLITEAATLMPHSMPPLGHVTAADTPSVSDVDQLVRAVSLSLMEAEG